MKHLMVILLSFLLASCAIFQGKSTPQQYTNDSAITTQIKSKFIGSDMVSAPSIHVETQNGVVQLSGFVSSSAQVQEAERIAKSVDGVKNVVNDLVVTPPKRYKRASSNN